MPVAVSGNALWLAKHNFKGDHPVFMILENNECVELGPGDGLPVVVDFTFENLRNVNPRLRSYLQLMHGIRIFIFLATVNVEMLSGWPNIIS